MRYLKIIAALGMVLAVTATAGAVSLQNGPLIFKTFDYEVSALYSGSPGVYYRDANVPGYDPNLGHKLFSDLTVIRPSDKGLMAGEDTWGLIDVTQLWNGTPVDGKGSPLIQGSQYWNRGDGDHYLMGMFYGGQDQIVTIVTSTLQTIQTSGLQFDLYDRSLASDPLSPFLNGMDPNQRSGLNVFPGWTGSASELAVSGISTYFLFTGNASAIPPGGQTTTYFDVDPNAGKWGGLFVDWWSPLVANSDIQQVWTVGTTYTSRWIGSEDTGRAFIIPEPLTMAGVFMSISGLGAYLRKRRRD